MMSKRNRRDDNEPPIVAALRAAHCSVDALDQPCDLLVITPDGVVWLLEIKNPKPNRPADVANPYRLMTPGQLQLQRRWQSRGGNFAVVVSAEQALEVVGVG